MIGFGSSSDWMRKQCREICKPITKRRNAYPIETKYELLHFSENALSLVMLRNNIQTFELIKVFNTSCRFMFYF